ENALDTTVTPPDLAAGTVTGSLPGSPAETDASNQLNGSGGVGTLTYALASGGNAATAGTFGTIQVNADGSYVYSLTSPVTEPTANNGTDTVNAAESFTYVVTDAAGNTATGTININIVDDVPTAVADSGNVNEGALLTVTAAGVHSHYVAAAHGVTMDGVRAAGGATQTAVSGGVGTNIAGQHGTLHLNAD